MKPSFRAAWHLATLWALLLGGYLFVCLWVPAGTQRTGDANVLLCLMPLLVNGSLLINAVTPDWRKRAFWMLLALGSTLWLAGQTFWTYLEVYGRRHTPYLFNGAHFSIDVLFYLHAIPMIAALVLRPHARADENGSVFRYVDFALILCWWLYLYVFAVIPWQFVAADSRRYSLAFSSIVLLQNFVFVVGAASFSAKTRGSWRRIYAHLAGARTIYVVRLLAIEIVAGRGAYTGGGLWDLPLLLSFGWMSFAGIVAYENRGEETSVAGEFAAGQAAGPEGVPSDDPLWASRAARMALLSLPLIGIWCMKFSQAPMAVHQFRTLVTLGAVLPLGFLVFLRHELVDRERLQLLRASQDSLDNLKRLQMQFVQSEKLASIGQLVGGAAHEINNPLTAILGYSELLAGDPTMGERTRSLAEKIREQARRTRTLVNNLLSFARQVPSEQRSTLDVNTVVNTAVQFRRFDLRGKNIRIEVQASAGIPDVRADINQMLQVFTHIINNAVYAMDEAGGGTLTVRTFFEKDNVIILFSDTGPGMRDPNLVFDPFYTTKPVGKGTGLGLSICYGLVRDQGGQVSCYNRPEGGATFRIELPAVPAAFPFSPRSVAPQSRTNPAKLA
jgi:signal transduction histidine kinase